MRVVVYGTGAVGSMWGALLARAGHDVHFVARGDQLKALQTTGVRISSLTLGEIVVHPVKASRQASGLGPADLVLVCVKAHQTPEVLEDLGALAADHVVFIALQNGIDGDDLLVARFGGTRVMSAVVYVGAFVEEPGTVRHVAGGLLLVGNAHGVPDERAAGVVEALNVPGLRARVADDIHRQRWYKLMWNTSFNAVSALTLRTSLSLLQIPETRALVQAVMREVVAVAAAEGVRLSEADIDKSIAETERIPAIRTSMQVDRERGRDMETDALVGVIVRRGRDAGVPTPVVSMLYGLLKAVATDRPAGVS